MIKSTVNTLNKVKNIRRLSKQFCTSTMIFSRSEVLCRNIVAICSSPERVLCLNEITIKLLHPDSLLLASQVIKVAENGETGCSGLCTALIQVQLHNS